MAIEPEESAFETEGAGFEFTDLGDCESGGVKGFFVGGAKFWKGEENDMRLSEKSSSDSSSGGRGTVCASSKDSSMPLPICGKRVDVRGGTGTGAFRAKMLVARGVGEW